MTPILDELIFQKISVLISNMVNVDKYSYIHKSSLTVSLIFQSENCPEIPKSENCCYKYCTRSRYFNFISLTFKGKKYHMIKRMHASYECLENYRSIYKKINIINNPIIQRTAVNHFCCTFLSILYFL